MKPAIPVLNNLTQYFRCPANEIKWPMEHGSKFSTDKNSSAQSASTAYPLERVVNPTVAHLGLSKQCECLSYRKF